MSNVFISYHFKRDLVFKEELSDWLKVARHRNYSLSTQDRSNEEIWHEIYVRSWVCSVIVVLIGPHTATSTWIRREINECLKVDRRFEEENARRIRKPKALLAIQLPGGPYPVPRQVGERLTDGTAVAVNWETISRSRAALDRKLELAIERRSRS